MQDIDSYLSEFSNEKVGHSFSWDWQKFGDQILAPLLRLLENGSSVEKYNAADIIRQMWFINHDYRKWILEFAVEPLIQNLQDDDLKTRGYTAVVLSDFRDKRALEPMISLAQDSSDYVRWVIAWSLGVFNDVRAIPALEWIRDNDTTWQLVKGQEAPYQQMNSDVANRTIEKLRNSE